MVAYMSYNFKERYGLRYRFQVLYAYLLNFIWDSWIHQSEKQISKWTCLSPKNAGSDPSRKCKSKVIWKQLQAQLEEIVVFPETKQSAVNFWNIKEHVLSSLGNIFFSLKLLSNYDQ